MSESEAQSQAQMCHLNSLEPPVFFLQLLVPTEVTGTLGAGLSQNQCDVGQLYKALPPENSLWAYLALRNSH